MLIKGLCSIGKTTIGSRVPSGNEECKGS